MIFFDEGPGDATGFQLEDAGESFGVGGPIELAPGIVGNAAEAGVFNRAVSADGDRADFDLFLPEEGDCRGVGWGRIAIADDDGVLDGCWARLEPLIAHQHGGLEVGHVAGLHPVELGHHRLVAASDLHQAGPFVVPQPVFLAGEVVPVGNAAVIHGTQNFQCFDTDDLLPVVPLRDFAGVHHHRQGTDRPDLGILDLKIDRHRLFKFGIAPAAGTEAVGAADHHDARPELLGIADEHGDLIVGEAGGVFHIVGEGAVGPRHVRQHHAVIGLQFRQARIELVAEHFDDFDVLLSQAVGQLVEFGRCIRIHNQQHASLPPHMGKGGGRVVLLHQILAGVVGHKIGPVDIAGGCINAPLQDDGILPRLEDFFGFGKEFLLAADGAGDTQFAFHRAAYQLAILVPNGGSKVFQHHAGLKFLAATNVGRQGDLFDGDFRGGVKANRNHINANAVFHESAGDGFGVPQVFLTVGNDDDSLGSVFGKRGLGQFKSGSNVSGVCPHLKQRIQLPAADGADFVGERWIFDGRFAAEDDHAGFVFGSVLQVPLAAVLGHVFHHIFQHRLASDFGDAL